MLCLPRQGVWCPRSPALLQSPALTTCPRDTESDSRTLSLLGPPGPGSPARTRWWEGRQESFPRAASAMGRSAGRGAAEPRPLEGKRPRGLRGASRETRSRNTFEMKGQNESIQLNLQLKVIPSTEASYTFQVSFL